MQICGKLSSGCCIERSLISVFYLYLSISNLSEFRLVCTKYGGASRKNSDPLGFCLLFCSPARGPRSGYHTGQFGGHKGLNDKVNDRIVLTNRTLLPCAALLGEQRSFSRVSAPALLTIRPQVSVPFSLSTNLQRIFTSVPGVKNSNSQLIHFGVSKCRHRNHKTNAFGLMDRPPIKFRAIQVLRQAIAARPETHVWPTICASAHNFFFTEEDAPTACFLLHFAPKTVLKVTVMSKNL